MYLVNLTALGEAGGAVWPGASAAKNRKADTKSGRISDRAYRLYWARRRRAYSYRSDSTGAILVALRAG